MAGSRRAGGELGELGQAAELLREHRRADRREAIRPAPVDRCQRFDEAALLEANERRVEVPAPIGRPVPCSTSCMIA